MPWGLPKLPPGQIARSWGVHEIRKACPIHQGHRAAECIKNTPRAFHYPHARSFASSSVGQASVAPAEPASEQRREGPSLLWSEGFWREGLPSPSEMRDGKWAGKGRVFVWAQVLETWCQGSSKATTAYTSHNDSFDTREGPSALADGRPSFAETDPAGDFSSSSRSHKETHDSKEWTWGGEFGPGVGARTWGNSGGRAAAFVTNHLFARRGGCHEHVGKLRMKRARGASRQSAPPRTCSRDPNLGKAGLFYFLALNPRLPKAPVDYRAGIAHPLRRFRRSPFQPASALPPPPSLPAPSYFRSLHTGRNPFPTAPISSAPSALQIRGYCAEAKILCKPFEALEAGFPVLLPLVAALKSTAAVNVIMVISRIALTALPLSLRAKFIYAVRERYLRDPEGASSWLRKVIKMHHPNGEVVNGQAMRLNASLFLPALILAPVVLTLAIIAASFERTPVTGRLRVMMLSPAEETDLVSSILAVGEARQERNPRDWVSILRSVLELEDEGVSAATGRRILLGGEVLDERDWRVRWTSAVLRRLETGVPMLATEGGRAGASGGAAGGLQETLLQPPPTRYPLAPRATSMTAEQLGWKGSLYMGKHRDGSAGTPTGAELACEYDLLVIERDEPNAFSFGFGPDEIDAGPDSKGRRGVVVVYTGFINDILGDSAPISAPPTPPASPTTPSSSMFTNFLGRSSTYSTPTPLPNLEPTVLPTREQTQSLAVLLSHELAHLVLSHTLESYASTSLLIPHLSKLGSDVLRTLIYPVTALLGPFFNDAIGRSMNEGASSGFGVVGQVFNSCASRTLEIEADLVALRLLSYSGIDPRYALDFWEDRLASSSPSSAHAHPASPSPTSTHLRLHSASHALPPLRMSSSSSDSGESEGGAAGNGEQACRFLASHPVDEERVQKIRDELVKWVSFRGSEFAV